MQHVQYRGVLRYQQGLGDPTVFRVIRGTWAGKDFERLMHLNEPAREIIRHNDEITFIVNKGDDFLQNASQYSPTFFDPAFVGLFARLPKQYSARIIARKALAGHSALGVYVAPKQKDRYGYRLWVDAESAVLLRFEMLDIEKRPLETFSFLDIEIGTPVTEKDANIQVNSGQVKLQMRTARSKTSLPVPKKVDWQPGWLPTGFILTKYDLQKQIGNAQKLHSLVYSDGLAAFSVYIERLSEGVATEHVNQRGGTVTTVRQTRDDKNLPHIVAVVGEVPSVTALRVAQSVIYQRDTGRAASYRSSHDLQPVTTNQDMPSR